MKKIFKYRSDDRKYGEYKQGEECEILGFTYQDEAPVVWTLHLADGDIVGVNPSCIEFARDEPDVFIIDERKGGEKANEKDFLKAVDELGDVLGKYWEDVDDVDEELRKIRRGEK